MFWCEFFFHPSTKSQTERETASLVGVYWTLKENLGVNEANCQMNSKTDWIEVGRQISCHFNSFNTSFQLKMYGYYMGDDGGKKVKCMFFWNLMFTKMNCVEAKLNIYMILPCVCVACPQVQHQDVALSVSSHGIPSWLLVFSAFPVFLSCFFQMCVYHILRLFYLHSFHYQFKLQSILCVLLNIVIIFRNMLIGQKKKNPA